MSWRRAGDSTIRERAQRVLQTNVRDLNASAQAVWRARSDRGTLFLEALVFRLETLPGRMALSTFSLYLAWLLL